MTRPLLYCGLSVLLLASCAKDGATPAYLQLGIPTAVTEGGQAASCKVTDCWVYLNDQPVGVWEPGSRIPLIGSGSARLKVIAGIRKDGVTDQRIQYPYYATWEQQVELVPEQAVSYSPAFHYYDGLSYWLADFEAGVRFDTSNCTAVMLPVPGDGTLVGEQTRVGRIQLDGDHPLYLGISSGDPFYGTDRNAFLEVDYRSDVELLFGTRSIIQGNLTETAYAYAAPTAHVGNDRPWNKIYINIGAPMSIPGTSDMRFFIRAELPSGTSSAEVEMDNIKLVQP